MAARCVCRDFRALPRLMLTTSPVHRAWCWPWKVISTAQMFPQAEQLTPIDLVYPHSSTRTRVGIFFVPPRFHLIPSHPQFYVTFAVMLLAGIFIGQLAGNLRFQARLLRLITFSLRRKLFLRLLHFLP